MLKIECFHRKTPKQRLFTKINPLTPDLEEVEKKINNLIINFLKAQKFSV